MQAWEEKVYERAEGRAERRAEGSNLKIINLVRKKIARHVSAEECAQMLEESIDLVKEIYDLVDKHPTVDDESIYRLLQAEKESDFVLY